MNNWISAHLFYTAMPDTLLIKLVAPLVSTLKTQQLLDAWFFIRYHEGGPHIRLRLLASSEQEAVVQKTVTDYAQAFFSSYPAVTASLQFIPYRQEIARYGNNATIRMAEQQFEASSTAVLQLINNAPHRTESQVMISAIKLHMAFLTAMAFSPVQIIAVCRLFIDTWLPLLYDRHRPANKERELLLAVFRERFQVYANQLVPAVMELQEALKAESCQDPILGAFIHQIKPVQQAYQSFSFTALAPVCVSFLHMAHNRLGIRNRDEAFIMYLLYQSLKKAYPDEQP